MSNLQLTLSYNNVKKMLRKVMRLPIGFRLVCYRWQNGGCLCDSFSNIRVGAGKSKVMKRVQM